MNVLVLTFACLGAIMGSFANALIHRLPREIKIYDGRSKCPDCDSVIKWYQNIPLLSYVFLGGKCGNCKTKIPFRYFLVELCATLGAIYFFRGVYDYKTLMFSSFYFAVFMAFLIHFFVDVEHQILPDSINLYLAALFITHSIVFGSWMQSLQGAALGFGLPWLVTWSFYKLRGQIGLGGGDIKLFAALGIILGPLGVVQNMFFSCLLGSVVAVVLMGLKLMTRDTPMPFGPMIILVSSVQLFFPKFYEMITSFIF